MNKSIPAWVSVALLLIQFAAGFVAYGRLQGRIDGLEYEVHIVLEKDLNRSSLDVARYRRFLDRK